MEHRIRQLRKEKGLSQGKLAALISVGTSAISKLEKGPDAPKDKKMGLTLDYMRRIAKALNCTPGDLLADTDVPYRLSDDEMTLLRHYRALDQGDQARVTKIVRTFADPEPADDPTKHPNRRQYPFRDLHLAPPAS